jgi:non-ribosomal peptide synthase protein (TIGR01720 family)
VGWFTTVFPVLLNVGSATDPGAALKAVKEQVRGIPNRGIGYGLLRYLSLDGEVAEKLRAQPQAEVSFNYLGQFDQLLTESAPFRLALESGGPTRSLRTRRSHLLDISASIVGGRFEMEWSYSAHRHARATIEALARNFIQALGALITHCRSAEEAGYTPSDFAAFAWSQEDLDEIAGEISKLAGQGR